MRLTLRGVPERFRSRSLFRAELTQSDIGLDKNPLAVEIDADDLASSQRRVATGRFVPAFGEREGVPVPARQVEAVLDRLAKDRVISQARQIEVPAKVLDELAQTDVVTAPQRYAV
jgi:hypothetical protein